jgi:hypothetical protein
VVRGEPPAVEHVIRIGQRNWSGWLPTYPMPITAGLMFSPPLQALRLEGADQAFALGPMQRELRTAVREFALQGEPGRTD